jgi:primosomal protein N' (replication factor Y) (superfamily II helicase)
MNHMERTVLFADVVLPLAVDGTFTYRVPLELNDDVAVGKRVVVQFGQKKVYAALVFKIHTKAPEHYTVKYILGVLDSRPVVFESQYRLWEWMSFYYHATLGEVMNAALPSAFKLASETQVILNPDFDGDFSVLSDTEYLITEALTLRNILSLTEITKITGQLKTFNLIKSLIEKGVILVEEGLKEKFRPRKETLIRLSDVYKEEDALRALFDILEKKAPKQFMLLLRYIQLAQKEGDMFSAVSRKTLLSDENFTASALDGMCKKNIFEAISEDVSRLSSYNQPLAGSLALSESQQLALEEINKQFETHTTVLLHGITSSGKTEIYVKLIEEQLQQDKQVLYLLPEIALTTQMITRLRKFFGNDIGVYHSRFNDRERIEIWNAVLHNDAGPRFNIILGARSALLLPFSNLGLIIVDEEHEVSYKQHFPAPFYNARDTAVYMGLHLGCKVLLGSATPSIESYYNSENGKFGRVNLMRRFNDLPMPEFEVVDMADLYKKKALKSFFSPRLLQNIETCLNNKEQVILFQNRRGFALWIECQNCHYIPGCPYCDVTLTYHKKTNDLKCHCCGHKTIVPDKCPACTSPKILMKSYGTERVEDELSIIYPKARIARMDLDTTRTKNALQDIINDFEDNRFDILVGTQMLGKGMDFGNVGLVGVLNADNLLNFPDFRSFERAFQLVSQVSGRTGRKNKYLGPAEKHTTHTLTTL